MYQTSPARFTATPVKARRPCAPVQATARSAHAHMLEVAAARRLRAAERGRARRSEDADYWKAVAPAAVAKARALRRTRGFARLP